MATFKKFFLITVALIHIAALAQAQSGPIPTYNSGTIDPLDATPVRSETSRGASVGGVSIEGLSYNAAVEKLRRELAPKLKAIVILNDGQQKYDFERAELGASIPLGELIRQARKTRRDVPLRFKIDLAQTLNAMRDLADEMSHPRDADANAQPMPHGNEGIDLDVSASAERIKKFLEAQPATDNITLLVRRRVPGGAGELTQFGYLLAEFSTPYNAALRGRTNNLRMAARHVNGTIVPPGGVFSANQSIGPRDAESGWKEAQMFVSGKVVSGVGAGICQCATTVYNAALLAGLPIVERHPHMFHVTYAAPSRDATLYWGSKDLRFRNDTGGSLYVQTFLKGGRFYARLFGTQPKTKSATVEARTLSRVKGSIRSEAYRVVYSGDTPHKELLSRDYYKPHP